MQKEKIETISTVALEYKETKSLYDKKDYAGVITRVKTLEGNYKNYAIKDSFDNLILESQKAVDERKKIDGLFADLKKNNEALAYENSLSNANELLKLNVSYQELEEIQKAKTIAEQKIAEKKAEADKKTQAEAQRLKEESSNTSDTVYITKTGAKYHNSGCRHLSKSQIPISLSDAQSSGYSACKTCH